jgi:uncharacterized protein
MQSCRPLPEIPAGSDAFIDANIFVYGLAGRSAQCRHFLECCSRDKITGITLFETVNEASHRFMLAEAKSKGLVQNESARELRKPGLISGLSGYWLQTERILAMNLLLLPVDEAIVKASRAVQQEACLLTNDSLIVSCMREYGIRNLASNDRDFLRVEGITVFCPEDLL